MDNFAINLTAQAPLVVGAYGFNLSIQCSPIAFTDDGQSTVTLVIKKKSGVVITKELTPLSYEEGLFSLQVSEDIFTEPGTYKFQVVQTGEDYTIKSMITEYPVADDIELS